MTLTVIHPKCPPVQSPAQAALRTARQVACIEEFILEHAQPGVFGGWTVAHVRQYIAFHLLHGTLHWAHNGHQVTGVGVVWQSWEKKLLANLAAGKAFDWTPTDPAGDSFVVAEWLTLHPMARQVLTAQFMRRFPGWEQRNLFAYRRDGSLHRLTATALRRLKGKA